LRDSPGLLEEVPQAEKHACPLKKEKGAKPKEDFFELLFFYRIL
jgi:hypothetical protein